MSEKGVTQQRCDTTENFTALLVGGSRDQSPVTGDFFRGIRQFHVPRGRLSL